MRALIVPAMLLAVTAATTAGAAPLEDLSHGGRYQLMELNEKVIRLDTETGGFEVCRLEGEDWSCQIAREERHDFEGRIAALEARIDRLETARAGDMAARSAEKAAARAQAQAESRATAEAQARQAAEAARQSEKGVVARLYDYVPEIGW